MYKGQAAILIIFVLGMISVLIAISLVKTGYLESMGGRRNVDSTKAFYAANSGVEDAFYRVNQNSSFTAPLGFEITFSIDADTDVKYSVEDKDKDGNPTDGSVKTIISTGLWKNYTRRIEVEVQKSSTKPGFLHAVHAGAGGFEMENNSKITGNVFSNLGIKADTSRKFKTNDDCINTSYINGLAIAVEKITKLSSGNGPCIELDALTKDFDEGYVKGSVITSPEPTPTPLPNMNLPKVKLDIYKKSEKYNSCNLNNTGLICDGETINTDFKLGNIYIFNDLIISSPKVYITGSIWVEGKIIFSSNSEVEIDDSLKSFGISQMFIAEKSITSSSNVKFIGKIADDGITKIFLLVISDYNPFEKPPENFTQSEKDQPCDTDKLGIGVQSNSKSVLFYSTNSCVNISTTAGETFEGAVLGQKIYLKNNSEIIYDSALSNAEFGWTKGGGWLTNSFEEF